jgi:hypothetical protein
VVGGDIVLNVRDPTEDKITKESFCEEVERVFDKFSEHHKKLLRDFSAKVGNERIFKQSIGNESLHKSRNNNGFRVENLPHRKIWLSKEQCYHIISFINLLRYHLMERQSD